MRRRDRARHSRPAAGHVMSAYPGQEYFHAHNANIRRAEENWKRRHAMSHPLEERASELASIICRGCRSGTKRVPFEDGSGALHQPYAFPSTDDYLCTAKANELLPFLTQVQAEARLYTLQ